MKIKPQDLNLNQLDCGNEPSKATKENAYSILQKNNKVLIVLNKPEVVYADDFIADIVAGTLLSGKTVEVDCGVKNQASGFISSELLSPDTLNKIFKQDGYLFSYGIDERRVREKLLSWGKVHVFVILEPLPKENLKEPQEQVHDHYNPAYYSKGNYLREDDYDPADYWKNIHLKDKDYDSSILDKETVLYNSKFESYFKKIIDDYDRCDVSHTKELIKSGATVEYLHSSWPDTESVGILIEKGSTHNEIIINTNDREEFDFCVLVANLASSFLREKNTVVVDWGNCCSEDLQERLNTNPIYSDLGKLAEEIDLQERHIGGRKHTFVTLHPYGFNDNPFDWDNLKNT